MKYAKELFTKNINYFIQETGMNQSELAKKVGVSATTVYDWVNGNKPASFDNLDKLATVFGTTVSGLFIDRWSAHPDDMAVDEEMLSFINNNRDVGNVLSRMKKLSDEDIRAYRTILSQVEVIRNNKIKKESRNRKPKKEV